MARPARASKGGIIYHALNRATGGGSLFRKSQDFAAFVRILDEASAIVTVRLLGYALMHTHWHLVLWPFEDGDLSRYVGWLSNAHVHRHHQHYKCHGTGHLYQGRFKSFPVQDDAHFITLMRYVEANPVRGGIVQNAGDWPWSSFTARKTPRGRRMLAKWPVPRPPRWIESLNGDMGEDDLKQVRLSVTRGRPLGSALWTKKTVRALGLESSLRTRGRPRKREREEPAP